MDKAKFIVLEGCDGCGKSEIIEQLKKEYSKNKDVLFVREPDFTETGKDISDILAKYKLSADVKLHLFMAARLELLNKVILPALAEGKTVISERFALSTWAYQCSEDDSLLSIMKSILDHLVRVCKVDNTIFIRSTTSEVVGKEDIIKNQLLGKLLIWYNIGLQGQEFPKELLGDILVLDLKYPLKDKIKAIKKIIDDDKSNNSDS